MLRLNDYPSHDDMLQIDWHTTGVFRNPQTSARAAYYGVSAAPDVYFDGIDRVLGASDSTSAYNTYRTIVNNHYNNQWSQIIINDAQYVLDMDLMTATVTFEVEVAPGETITNPSNVKLRSAAYEDGLIWCCEPRTGNNWWNHIGRALGTEATLTVSQGGQTQQYTGTFTISPTWVTDNLHVVVLVQRDSNKNVLQSAEACNAYAVSVENLSPIVASSTVPVDFDVELTYTGCLDDDVVVTLDESELPGDWDAEIVVGQNTFPNSTTFPNMTQGQVQPYVIRVIPGATAALGTVHAETAPVTSPEAAKTETYRVFAHTPAILYVNDDNNGSSQAMFESAITAAGHFYFTHDVDTQGEPSAELIAGFDAVVWNTGQSQGNTISTTAQAALVSFCDGGGKVFVTSQGLLNNHGSTPNFIRNYLRVLSFQQDQQALTCTGVGGDPIGDGLSFSVTGGPFPDFSDVITANTGGVIWLLGQFGNVAVHYDSGTFKTVFMTPALELAPVASRNLIVDRVLEWFFGTPTDVTLEPGTTPAALSLAQNSPNPFGSATTVRFAVPAEGPVSLEVFDVGGRRVARLVDRPLVAGSHTVMWDGRDASGSRVASGVYLYRLTAGGQSTSREMVLRR